MKRRIIAIITACMALAAAGCGDKAENGNAVTDTETENALPESEEEPTVASIDIAYNAEDYVTLGDYMGMEVTLNESDYQVTEEAVNNFVDQSITYAQPYLKDDSKTVIQEGDVVDVNYVGKKDGAAFDGGSAENQIIDVSANSNVTTGTGYIEGFTDGLIGAKVGETVDCEATFPDDYYSEDLKGQTVVFSFTINSIGSAVTRETIDDAYVLENFQANSVEEFYENTRKTLEQQAEETKKSDIRNAVMQNLLDVCSVTSLPEQLVDARLAEYVESFRNYYCSDGVELEDFLQSNYGVTEEEFLSQNRTYMESSLSQELILEVIAEKENVEFDQEDYDQYIENILKNGGYASKEDLYGSLGSTQESGENYFKKLYLENKACDLVAEQAVVNYAKAEENTESVENTEE